MFRNLKSSPYIDIVDDVKTFTLLYKLLPKKCQLQWVGRTRSSGESGVGYLSFLIREKPIIKQTMTTTMTTTKEHLPDGMFITAYDSHMNTRECLGQWFNTKSKVWTTFIETNLIKKVIDLAKTTSRLTGGQYIDIPVLYYTITYLYKDTKNDFIRGWHGILNNAFYLSDVFLENTFNNGKWFNKQELRWQAGNTFNLTETFKKLNIKSGHAFTHINTSKLTKKQLSIKKNVSNTNTHASIKTHTISNNNNNNKPYTLYYSKNLYCNV